MIPKTEFDTAEPADPGLAALSAGLARDIVDVAGFIDTVDSQARGQLEVLGRVRAGAERIGTANAAVRDAAVAAAGNTSQIRTTTEATLAAMRAADTRTRSVAVWVEELDSRMTDLEQRLSQVTRNTKDILDITRQVDILAINAKIEAARAGDAGRGFAVVAEAINGLSKKTSAAAEDITGSIAEFSELVANLRGEAATISQEAGEVRSHAERADADLSTIAEGLSAIETNARKIAQHSEDVEQAGEVFGPSFGEMSTSLNNIVSDITSARDRVHGLIDGSEEIVQRSFSAGGASEDAGFVAEVQTAAAEIGMLLETAVEHVEISVEALFGTNYRLMPGSDPPQHMARFTQLTDRLFPPLHERLLSLSPSVGFCAAVDRNGYLPTHNRKFSQPQGSDPVWNAANSRNRRIFNDRVGLKAGRNTQPFLLQVYRRDMGGGVFKLMKDLSAPIRVRGRHWGGLRLAIAF